MIIEVTVKTGSKKGPLLEKIPPATGNYQTAPNASASKVPTPTNAYLAYLREKPHDNTANTALLKLLSKTFHVPKTQIKILSGQKSHHKKIDLPDPSQT